MHCSANEGPDGDAAVFFGLSGTGKTTLSADPSRTLIGDDEHGWGPDGIFNFEGGCYAKTIRLSAEAEPEIFATTQALRHGAGKRRARRRPACRTSTTASLTENTRCAYPLDFIPNASETGRAGHPKNIIMLTADAFGVMPPIARLTPAQAMYHFLSGYTAKVAGTETRRDRAGSDLLDLLRRAVHAAPSVGIRRPAARLIAEHGVDLLAGQHRLDRRRLRHRQAHADQGDARAACRRARRLARRAPNSAPTRISASPCRSRSPASTPAILDPRATWADKAAYDRQARKLVGMFIDNFEKFEAHVDAAVLGAAPRMQEAAE